MLRLSLLRPIRVKIYILSREHLVRDFTDFTQRFLGLHNDQNTLSTCSTRSRSTRSPQDPLSAQYTALRRREGFAALVPVLTRPRCVSHIPRRFGVPNLESLSKKANATAVKAKADISENHTTVKRCSTT